MAKEDTNNEATVADEPAVGRRDLLRRAGTIVAVAGGAAALTATTGGSAQAASGDPVLMGSPNDAGASATSLTSSAGAAPSLLLANTGTGHGPLAIKANDATVDTTVATSGELFNSFGDLYYVSDFTAPSGSIVYTDFTSFQLLPIDPIRMLDTRDPNQRGAVVDTSVLDSAGRLRSGQWLELDLTSLAEFATGVFVNVVAVLPLAGGYLTLAPTTTADLSAPPTASVNFTKGAVVGNGQFVGLNDTGSLFIFALGTSHVVLDVTAVNTAFTLLSVPPAGAAVLDKAVLAKRMAAYAKAAARQR